MRICQKHFTSWPNIKKKALFQIWKRAFYLLVDKDYLLTAFPNSVPALNLATFLAAILIAFPV
jgi:hypothetical protein